MLRRYGWMLPIMLGALAATRAPLLAVPALLALLTWLPGWQVTHLLRLSHHWDRPGHIALSLALSLALTPVLLNPLWHVTNDPVFLVSGLCLVLTGVGLGLRFLEPPPDSSGLLRTFELRRTRILALVLAAYLALATIGTYWPTELLGWPVPALIHDFIKHQGVLFSLQQQPLPLGNPFFADGSHEPAYYYHFFYLIPATLRAVCPTVEIELAFGVQAALVAMALAALPYLLIKRLLGGEGPAALAALLVSVIGGWDVFPLLLQGHAAVTLDAWADTLVRIHAFLTQAIWTPQNVQGVLIGLLAAYVLSTRGFTANWLWFGPLLALGLIGSTVWVAAALLPGAALVWMVEFVGRRSLRVALAGLVVGVLAAALALPTVRGYAEMARRHEKGLTLEWPHPSHAVLGKLAPPGVLANLLDLPWVLLLEFGALAVLPAFVLPHVWRTVWRDPGLRFLILSGGVALAGFVTVRSSFTYNDFGQKIILVTMAAAALAGACAVGPVSAVPRWWNPLGWTLPSRGGRPRPVAAALIAFSLVAGLPVALFQTPLAAVRRYLPPQGWMARFASAEAQRAGREQAALLFLRHELPPEAVVQADPSAARLELLQLCRRQMGVMPLEQDTHVFIGRDPSLQKQALDEVAAVLAAPCDVAECRTVLRRHGITHVYVGEVERQRWRGLEKLEDPAQFACVFRSEALAVYALRP